MGGAKLMKLISNFNRKNLHQPSNSLANLANFVYMVRGMPIFSRAFGPNENLRISLQNEDRILVEGQNLAEPLKKLISSG